METSEQYPLSKDDESAFAPIDVGFWGKNGGGSIKLQRLGKIGKAETFEKRLKIFENCIETFENIQKLYRNV